MKSRIVATILALVFGGLGVHRFYLGQNFKGVMYLLFCWTGVPAIIALIDTVRYWAKSEDEFNAKYNPNVVAEGKDGTDVVIQSIKNVGQAIEAKKQEQIDAQFKTCPKCGAKVPVDSMFCDECGNRF